MIVYYHSPCCDGFCSWWLFQKAHPNAIGRPIEYGKGVIEDVKGQDVFFLDYCPSVIPEDAASVTIIDHHKSAIDAYKPHPKAKAIFDMNRSAAMMVADLYDFKPWVVDYVQDRDLWRFSLPDSKIITAAIAALPEDLSAWDVFVDQGPSRAKMYGFGILQCNERMIDAISRQKVETVENGMKIRWFNSPVLQSELGDRFSKEYDLVLIWSWSGTFRVSCRSRNGQALEYAKARGGGGHPNAARFDCGVL